MYLFFFVFLITTLIANLMIILSLTLSKKSFNDLEKISPFECGFDPMSNSRIPFSLHFFLISIIFLIFDVEITLLMPIISIFEITNLINWIYMTIFFLLILIVGLYYEWMQNMLNWTN
uniref:NADH dehydrogenase subunit 3 n=1 Tax=Goera martynowi TaxID=3399597 RepID=UPI0022DCE333|nr:NADH dehydrogenase subunit 3 [Goera horni]UZZ43967.1 NADH dehydrogenase subunit 3 [Goera horni]